MNASFDPSPEAEERQQLYLQDLGYQCAVLEEELRTVVETLSAAQRAVIEEYIAFRDTMEVESIRAAIRFGERRARKEMNNR